MKRDTPGRSYYVYMIRTGGDRLYTGYTTDPVRRYLEHRSGGRVAARFTRAFRPRSMAFCLRLDCSRGEVLKVEAALKKLTRQEKLELISGSGDPDALVAECCGRVPRMARMDVGEIERAAGAGASE